MAWFGRSIFAATLGLAAMLVPAAWAGDKDGAEEVHRMDAAATVLNEVMGTPDKASRPARQRRDGVRQRRSGSRAEVLDFRSAARLLIWSC
jgi:hypothetical protein